MRTSGFSLGFSWGVCLEQVTGFSIRLGASQYWCDNLAVLLLLLKYVLPLISLARALGIGQAIDSEGAYF